MATYIKRAGAWRAQVRKRGVQASQSFKSKAEAVAWATKFEAEILAGTRTPGNDRTVADALKEYGKRVSPTKRTERSELFRIAAFIREFPDLAARPLSEVNASHFGDWRDRRLEQVGSATVLREINLFSHVFTTARDEWKWIQQSPFAGMRRPAEPQPRQRKLTEDEITAVTRALGYEPDYPPVTSSSRAAAMMLFALETAMRAGEIVGMRWEQVHVEKRFVHLPRTKNGSARDVPLSPGALAILRQMEGMRDELDGSVFGITSANLDVLFRKGRLAAGVAGFTFHDTRRTALTRMARIFNVMELAKISGHLDLRLLQSVYYAPDATDLADKFNASE
ncbi:tyrosine-type recombinase/integrase [Chitinasiproducens palmae]|uniref:Integrase n=1 Tax=Chitinasiproducens palmae TaxID=1770053 RepID=A0A1H2PRU5_9BURK|nr:site-specific integrase [Chitinasiproducens palmae]SDV49256.1 Integrase [Chitinasiproducens palmae]